MIGRIKGKLVKRLEGKVLIEVGGLCYEINVPKAVSVRLDNNISEEIEFIIYHYLHMEKNRGVPILIGFSDELEKDFFETFITVVGIGPRAALKAFDRPVSLIARAIEEGDLSFLRGLSGVGHQKAKQIIAHLQGKVGRFALIKGVEKECVAEKKEVIQEAKQVLKRLQYSAKEIDSMIKKVLTVKPDIDSVENLLNEIYRQRQ